MERWKRGLFWAQLCGAVVLSASGVIAASSPPDDHRARDSDDAKKFASEGAVSCPAGNGRIQLVHDNNPFRGGGKGMYGGTFFGGGAGGSVAVSANATTVAPGRHLGSVNGTGGSGSGGGSNAGGGSSADPAAPGGTTAPGFTTGSTTTGRGAVLAGTQTGLLAPAAIGGSAVAVTPEPSTLFLTGTALLGAAFAFRRRQSSERR